MRRQVDSSDREIPYRRAVADPCRCPEAFFDNPDLVLVRPVPTTADILGREEFDRGENGRA
jgi:hypothetical protein